MKLKYYIRGIGIGIIFSTIVFSVALSTNKSGISEKEVIERAKKLGMVMSEDVQSSSDEVTLEDLIKPSDKVAEEPKTEEPKAEESKAEEPKAEEPKVEEPKAEESKAEEPKAEEPKAEEPKVEEPKAEEPMTEEPKAEEPKAEESKTEEPKKEKPSAEKKEPATIYVKSGMNSYDVAKLMKDAGLVSDATKYDDFLKANGYSRSIRTGDFRIPFDLSNDEMAKILTRN